MRLGLIGGKSNKATSGVYRPEDVILLQNAKRKISQYGFDAISNPLSSIPTAPEGFDVSRDGRYVYFSMRGSRTTAAIYQYECSVPWDISTMTYSSKVLIVGEYEQNVVGVAISDDGTKLFFNGYARDNIWSCTLSTPYDLGTAKVDVRTLHTGVQDGANARPIFGDSGTKVYLTGQNNDSIYQYTLSTAWDIGTGSYANKSFSVTSQDTAPRGIFFRGNGLAFYMVGSATDSVYQYTLSTAWDISTASYASKSKAIGTEETEPRALFFKPDGTKMYVSGITGDDVNEYNLSTAWDVSTATFSKVSSNIGDTNPVGLWFKSDGSRMYICASTGTSIRQFDLSTPWDVSTISFSKSLSLLGLETISGVAFDDSGDNIYISSQNPVNVFQIPLVSSWDIETPTKFLRISSSPLGIWINSDGTEFFTSDNLSNGIRRYTMSTPYEVSTATQSQSLLTITTATSVHVLPDGFTAFVGSRANGGREIRQINMTSPFDLSTGEVSTTEILGTFGVTGSSTNIGGVRLAPDETIMWFLSDVTKGLYQYSLRF